MELPKQGTLHWRKPCIKGSKVREQMLCTDHDSTYYIQHVYHMKDQEAAAYPQDGQWSICGYFRYTLYSIQLFTVHIVYIYIHRNIWNEAVPLQHMSQQHQQASLIIIWQNLEVTSHLTQSKLCIQMHTHLAHNPYMSSFFVKTIKHWAVTVLLNIQQSNITHTLYMDDGDMDQTSEKMHPWCTQVATHEHTFSTNNTALAWSVHSGTV